MKFLSKEKLKKLNIPRLKNVLKLANKEKNCIFRNAGPRCCEICNEYIGDNWEKDVVIPAKPYTNYCQLVLSVIHAKTNQIKIRK